MGKMQRTAGGCNCKSKERSLPIDARMGASVPETAGGGGGGGGLELQEAAGGEQRKGLGGNWEEAAWGKENLAGAGKGWAREGGSEQHDHEVSEKL